MSYKLFEFGGNPELPIINIAPANGFVPQTYIPMTRNLTESYRVISMLPRTLWGISAPTVTPQSDWAWIGEDLLSGLQKHDYHNLVAIGHSSGGIGTLLAALEEPQRFRALILLDPVILTREQCHMMREVQAANQHQKLPMPKMAMRRRDRFADVEEAYQRFREKGLFADWSDEAVRLYAQHGTKPAENGERTLTWPAEWEAYIFSTVHTKIWDVLPRVGELKDLPMLIVNGGTSDTFVPEAIEGVRALVPQATYRTIEGHGHLFPQSAPQETSALILNWLGDIL